MPMSVKQEGKIKNMKCLVWQSFYVHLQQHNFINPRKQFVCPLNISIQVLKICLMKKSKLLSSKLSHSTHLGNQLTSVQAINGH